jgi:N-acetylornithine carbamoyltransferase
MTASLPAAVSAALSQLPSTSGPAHFLTGLEPGRVGLGLLLDLAVAVREHERELARARPLAGRVCAGMFFDPSLRTRTSLAVACAKLGATYLDLNPSSSMWTLEFGDEVVMDGNAAEHVREAAGALGQYADVIGLRAHPTRGAYATERSQPIHAAFAAHSGVPVVNLEGPYAHPCQGLADALTLRDQLGDPAGKKFVLSWAPHPQQLGLAVPHSALWAAATLGMEVVVAHPVGFELDPEALRTGSELAAAAGGAVTVTNDRRGLFDDATVVYARGWGAIDGAAATASGHADALRAHRDWMVRQTDLVPSARAKLMHALPVRRGVEVSDALLDGPSSIVLAQAANRIWAQAALLLTLLGEGR